MCGNPREPHYTKKAAVLTLSNSSSLSLALNPNSTQLLSHPTTNITLKALLEWHLSSPINYGKNEWMKNKKLAMCLQQPVRLVTALGIGWL